MLEKEREELSGREMWMDHCPWRGIVGCRCCLILLQDLCSWSWVGGWRGVERGRLGFLTEYKCFDEGIVRHCESNKAPAGSKASSPSMSNGGSSDRDRRSTEL